MDDAPDFITNMAAWFAAHPVVWHSYWESNSDAKCSLMDGTKPKSAAAYKAAFGPKVQAAAAPALSVTNSQGATATVIPNADGSAVIEVTFPTIAATVTYDLKLSSPRKLGFATAAGELSGSLWENGTLLSAFPWATRGGTARVYVAPPTTIAETTHVGP